MVLSPGSTLLITIFISFIAVQNIEGGVMNLSDILKKIRQSKLETTTESYSNRTNFSGKLKKN